MYNGRTVAYLNNYSSPEWVTISKEAPFDIEGIAGNNANGPVIYNGDQVAYLNNYDAPEWTVIKNNCPYSIQGMAGDNSNGCLVFNKIQFSYLQNYANPTWYDKQSTPNNITSIAGNIQTGAIALLSNNDVYIMDNYNNNNWVKLDLFVPNS